MSAIDELDNLVKPDFGDFVPWSTGNFRKDVKAINDYVRTHPQKFTSEDRVNVNGSVECRSKLIILPDIRTGIDMYHYVTYNKDGLAIAIKALEIYNP